MKLIQITFHYDDREIFIMPKPCSCLRQYAGKGQELPKEFLIQLRDLLDNFNLIGKEKSNEKC